MTARARWTLARTLPLAAALIVAAAARAGAQDAPAPGTRLDVHFAMVETGFTRAKNAVNTMAMNLVIYPIGLIGFWLTGYALMMGGVAQWPSLGRGGIPSRELSLHIGGHSFGLIGAGKF